MTIVPGVIVILLLLEVIGNDDYHRACDVIITMLHTTGQDRMATFPSA